MMGLTRCYKSKTAVFTVIFAVFQHQPIAEILLLPLCENKRPSYWNFTSGFDFELFVVIRMWLCTDLPNYIPLGRSATELWRYVDFQDGGHTVAIYFRFLVLW